MVHGDDFTLLGFPKDLDWFRIMITNRLEIKFRGRLGSLEISTPDVVGSIRILNRIVTWEGDAITYEADQRHAELIVRLMNLSGAKPVKHREKIRPAGTR